MIRILCVILAITATGISLFSQSTDCLPPSENDFSSEAYLNYGYTNNSYNSKYRVSGSVGQPIVESSLNTTNVLVSGSWSQFLVPPLPVTITASQGEFLDRIQVNWTPNPLGPLATLGYKLYRDGIYLALMDPGTFNYNDFNVIAGRAYRYSVRASNDYGDGSPSETVGFMVPNGTVTGWVSTSSSNPVTNALVSLTPLQGYSMLIDASPAAGGGVVVDTTSGTDFFPLTGSQDYSVAFWMKNKGQFTGNILEFDDYALTVKGYSDGIQVYLGAEEASSKITFEAGKETEWYHIAITHSDNSIRVYLNGELKSLKNVTTAVVKSNFLYLGDIGSTGGDWRGSIDELRIYHRRLDEVALVPVMTTTASATTADLKYYWKFDEQLGDKSFDLIKRVKLYFCGATFSTATYNTSGTERTDIPYVLTAALTNSSGFYAIESASYGTGTTFTARASKAFYMNWALQFTAGSKSYAVLPDFSLTPQTSIETWVYNDGPEAGTQTLFSKRRGTNQVSLSLSQNVQNPIVSDLVLRLASGQQAVLGEVPAGYTHITLTIDSTGPAVRTIKTYLNGDLSSVNVFPGVMGNWSDSTSRWILGADYDGSGDFSNSANYTNFFTGLIDEFSVYNSILDTGTIRSHVLLPKNLQESGLRVYFALNEGDGDVLHNAGSLPIIYGNAYNCEWSTYVKFPDTKPHEFVPATRLLTLNPSVTSVDQTDFTDKSLLNVTGYVRYQNSDCFASNVEILVNGASYTPQIFTDSTGKFSLDMEPGKSATLEPVFSDHAFTPSFWEINKITAPITGIVFIDNTTRRVTGQVAGGDCRKSVLKYPPGQGQGTRCVVKLQSLNECYERTDTLYTQDGKYSFTGVPALSDYTVAVVEHSDPVIKAYYQSKGGSSIDLSERDTVIDFIYYANPEVKLASGLEPIQGCNKIVLESGDLEQIEVQLIEQYEPEYLNGVEIDEGVCVLDTANFRFINLLAGEILDTVLSRSNQLHKLKYKFRVGDPAPTPPYTKLIQIIGESKEGQSSSISFEALIEGIVNRENTFTSITPTIPTLILRDPPGDASYAYVEAGTTICTSSKWSLESENETGFEMETDLAPDVTLVLAPLGVGVLQTTEGDVGPTASGSIKFGSSQENTTDVCITLSETISTSDDELIVGSAQGGDVYLGTAINMVFGFATVVRYEPDSCMVKTEKVLNTKPGGATTYMYSEWMLTNSIIPYLIDLEDFYKSQQQQYANDPALSAIYQDSINLCRMSYQSWQGFINDNKNTITASEGFIGNYSWDAGVIYEYSSTLDSTAAQSLEQVVGGSVGVGQEFGFEVLGVGVTLKVDSKDDFTRTTADGDSTNTYSRTVGYVFADNDVQDAFSVDVAWDPQYHTPTFITRSGQSSCPWEPGTAHMDGCQLTFRDGSTPTVINVPSNEPAVFLFNLANNSQTLHTRTYAFSVGPESNTGGAVIKLNGAPLYENFGYQIPIDTTNNVDTSTLVGITLTVERGPIEYEYDSLEVALFAECEVDRGDALGTDPAADPITYSAQFISVHFIRPCSEVAITSPEQNYVILQSPDTEQQITVSEYNLDESLFKLVRTQYRRKNGDGAWITLEERYNPNWVGYNDLPNPKPSVLETGFTQFYWETAGQPDGEYELRAVAECTGSAADKPGISKVIDIRIDRQPPSIVSMEPADGVYEVGDQISFTFDKPINTSKFLPPFFNNLGKIDVFDASTSQLIPTKVTAYQNQIFIIPEIQNEYVENRLLRIELKNLEDLAGNTTGPQPMKWLNRIPEIYVNRNELSWLTDSVGMTKPADKTRFVVANIYNGAGYPVPFEIRDYPDWIRAVPNAGTLAPNEIRPIVFTADSSLAFGFWRDSVTLRALPGVAPPLAFMGGDERIPIGVRVVCKPPEWDLDPSQFENSMNMVVKLNVQGTVSNDVEDIVGAFIDGQLRGRANVQYVPQVSLPDNKVYLAYITIYGSSSDLNKPVSLQIWDASACLLYGTIAESYTFTPDGITGVTNNPATATTNSMVLRQIPISPGWNWISFNLAFSNPAINPVLSSLKYPANDLIKSQTQFANYYNSAWVGSLATFDNRKLYQYRSDKADTIQMLGMVLPDTMSVYVRTGWNWIGYLPSYSLSVNNAFSGLVTDGWIQAEDLVKSRSGFAQYIVTPVYTGWVGSLNYMMPPNGYQLKLNRSGVTNAKLTYPLQGLKGEESPVASRGGNMPSFWTVDPSQYEKSATLIGMISANGVNLTGASMELGAFSGDEVRGSAQALFVEPLNSYLFFLTYYANGSGDPISFKLYNGDNGQICELNETMFFAADNHQGSVDVPLPFTCSGLSNTEELSGLLSLDVRPNPFSQSTEIRFSLPDASPVSVTITDLSGKTVSWFEGAGLAGINALEWKGTSDNGTPLQPGVYFVKLKSDTGQAIRKVILQR